MQAALAPGPALLQRRWRAPVPATTPADAPWPPARCCRGVGWGAAASLASHESRAARTSPAAAAAVSVPSSHGAAANASPDSNSSSSGASHSSPGPDDARQRAEAAAAALSAAAQRMQAARQQAGPRPLRPQLPPPEQQVAQRLLQWRRGPSGGAPVKPAVQQQQPEPPADEFGAMQQQQTGKMEQEEAEQQQHRPAVEQHQEQAAGGSPMPGEKQQAQAQAATGTSPPVAETSPAPPPAPAQPLWQPCVTPPSGFITSPVYTVSNDTRTLALAGSMAQAAEVHPHLLLFAVGPHAANVAVKALATAREFVRDATGGARDLLVQPTLRGRVPRGLDSFAFDVMLVPAPLALDPGTAGPGDRRVRITGRAFEAEWARNMVANMPRRGQTVVKVAGAYAVENAVKSTALARRTMQRAHGQDLVFVPMWDDQRWRGSEGAWAAGGSSSGGSAADDGQQVPGSEEEQEEGNDRDSGSGSSSMNSSGRRQQFSMPRIRPKLRLAVMRVAKDNPLNVLTGRSNDSSAAE